MAYTIILSCDQHEGEEFAAWLNGHGHDATIGNSTGSYVDGAWTSSDESANDSLRRLWDEYCNG